LTSSDERKEADLDLVSVPRLIYQYCFSYSNREWGKGDIAAWARDTDLITISRKRTL